MSWIRTLSDEEATGAIAGAFETARKRAGRVYNIVRIMSLNPKVLRSSMDMYLALMFGPSPLTRDVREMLATVVSLQNNCYY